MLPPTGAIPSSKSQINLPPLCWPPLSSVLPLPRPGDLRRRAGTGAWLQASCLGPDCVALISMWKQTEVTQPRENLEVTKVIRASGLPCLFGCSFSIYSDGHRRGQLTWNLANPSSCQCWALVPQQGGGGHSLTPTQDPGFLCSGLAPVGIPMGT